MIIYQRNEFNLTHGIIFNNSQKKRSLMLEARPKFWWKSAFFSPTKHLNDFFSSKMAHKYVKWYDPEYVEKWFARSEKHRPYSSFVIQFNLLHPQPSMFLLSLLPFQFRFVVFLNLKIVNFVRHKKTFDICDKLNEGQKRASHFW